MTEERRRDQRRNSDRECALCDHADGFVEKIDNLEKYMEQDKKDKRAAIRWVIGTLFAMLLQTIGIILLLLRTPTSGAQ